MRPLVEGLEVTSVQVLPSSTDLNNFVWFGPALAPCAPPPPPAGGVALSAMVVVKITLGMSKGEERSRAPVSLSGCNVLVQVWPPLSVRKIPRCVPVAPAMVAAITILGSLGSTMIFGILVVPSRPMCVQVLPASVDLYMPSPLV